MANDTKVKIKFDTTSIAYNASNLDFNMATAFFRGTEIPVTGSQTYGTTSDGISVRHYGVVVFASSNGDTCTLRNGTILDCFSLEVKAGAVLRSQDAGSTKPAKINSQTQPIIRGVWSFASNDGKAYQSPKNQWVNNVGSGGTGLSKVEPHGILKGNSGGAMQDLEIISPGTNGYVLTMVSGVPAWAASSGGGGGSGTVTSIATTAPITGGTITTSGTIGISAATTSAAGSMSSADKTKLDGVATGATANTGALADLDTVGTSEIDDDAVTYAKVQNVSATNRILGRDSAGAGVIEEITPANVRTMLNVADGATAYADSDAVSAVEATSSLDLTGNLTFDTTKKIVMDEATYASATPSSGTIEITSEKTGSNSPLLTLRTPSGYLRIGPQNASFCHFYTDRSYFYFNKPIQMDGGSFYAYNDDLLIKTDDSGSGQPTRIFIDAGVDPCRVGIGNGFTSSNLPATELEVAGTIRQSNATSAVLVADANGDLVAATNLGDNAYVQDGQAGSQPFTIGAPGAPTNWAGAPPATIDEAINRLAAWAQTAIPGPIP